MWELLPGSTSRRRLHLGLTSLCFDVQSLVEILLYDIGK
jgi:hypothetical protein